MKRWMLGGCLCIGLLALGCGSSSNAPAITIAISPTAVTVVLGTTQQFTATVSGTTHTNVTFQVNSVTGGNATVGTISSGGLYTAPQAVPRAM